MALKGSSNEIFSSNNDFSLRDLDLQDAIWEIWWIGQIDREGGRPRLPCCYLTFGKNGAWK